MKHMAGLNSKNALHGPSMFRDTSSGLCALGDVIGVSATTIGPSTPT
jgi:hypothetical protein